MADANMQDFDKRMQRIVKNHRALAEGYVTTVNHDGLIIARPRRRARFPWRGILFSLLIVMGFKVFLHAGIGAAAYDERVMRLASGTMAEQVGAFVLTADPVTVSLSSTLATFLK